MNQFIKILISDMSREEGLLDKFKRDFELFYNQVNGEYKLGLWQNIREKERDYSLYYISVPEDRIEYAQQQFSRYGSIVTLEPPFPADIQLVHGDPDSL